MASLRKDIHLRSTHGAGRADATAVWDAVRDFGGLHDRLVPGFVTATRVEEVPGLGHVDRIVTFASGAQARERLVSVDDERRRLVYAVVESPFGAAHHQASVEVLDTADGVHLVWTTDLLPDGLAPMVDVLMDQGAAIMARTLG